MKSLFIIGYPLLFTLIGQISFPFASDSPPQKYSIEEILKTYTQATTISLCTQTYSTPARSIASVSKNELTSPSPSSTKGQDNSLKPSSCWHKMKSLQKLLILPPILNSDTNQDIISQKQVWEILNSHFQNKQLKAISWERMDDLLKGHPDLQNSPEVTLQKHPDSEKILKLAQLTDASTYLTVWINAQKIKTQVYSLENGLLWEEESHQPSTHNLESLEQNINTMAKNFLNSLPYDGVQILDPLWKKAIFEKDFQNLAKVDVGTTSSIQKNDIIVWVEICRINKAALFKDGGQIHILAKGKVLKKERGVLLVNITHHKAGVSDWKQRIHEGTLVISTNNKENHFIADKTLLETQLYPIKNNADKVKARLTITSGIFSILVLLAILL